MLDNFSEIKVETTVDKIIRQIRSLITSGQIAAGDKLPPERKLAERLGVSRNHVREAIKKLEFYGILKTLPQSGTVVAGIGITALEGFITDVLKLEDRDFASLVETRHILESHNAYLAAERRTPEDLVAIKAAMDAYDKKIQDGTPAVEEDLMFHIAIAEASKNTVLTSLMLIIAPDIVHNFVEKNICTNEGLIKAAKEHKLILEHITNRDAKAASKAMRGHLKEVLEFSQAQK